MSCWVCFPVNSEHRTRLLPKNLHALVRPNPPNLKHFMLVQITVSISKSSKICKDMSIRIHENQKMILRLNCPISLRFLTFLKSRDEILFKGGRFVTSQNFKTKKIIFQISKNQGLQKTWLFFFKGFHLCVCVNVCLKCWKMFLTQNNTYWTKEKQSKNKRK